MPTETIHLRGVCHALYGLSIARGVDLELAAARLHRSQRASFRHKLHFPAGAGMVPPLRVSWGVSPMDLGPIETRAEVELALFGSGALCVTWPLPVEGTLEELVAISALLYDHGALIARSRELAEEVMKALGPTLDRPRLANHVEDYVLFEMDAVEGGPAPLLEEFRAPLAGLLRAEARPLSAQEVEDALAHPVSYGERDLCLVDWLAAFLTGHDMGDERLVLEIATVELLELHRLDSHLQREIGEAYELLARPRSLRGVFFGEHRELERVARMQADDARLHEGIDNALKLFGDDYLARLYRTAAARFHFEDWDASIQRKLGVLRDVYQSLADQAAHRRAEALEWIIILLIAVDIVVYFVGD